MSWTPDYKVTTKGWYFRFRHDDRHFRCYKCGRKNGTKECYIDKLVRNQTKKVSPSHPLYKIIRDLEQAVEIHKIMAKTIGKIADMSKMWPLTEDEDTRGVQLIKELRLLFDTCQLCIWMAAYEKKLSLGGEDLTAYFDEIRKGNPIMLLLGNDIHTILRLLEYVYMVKSKPLRVFVDEMQTKYGIPYLMLKKKITRLKQQEGAFGTGKWD
jgi:hypothetical protein